MLKITYQGAPIVNPGVTYLKKYSDVVVLEVDLKSKWCDILAHSVSENNCPVIIVYANERSINLNKEVDRRMSTNIEFPEYKGWSIFLAEITRYTLRVCLIKD